MWACGRVINLDSGASAASILLLPFPARQFHCPTDLVPPIQADKRHSWKAGNPGPVWRNSIIATEKRWRREGIRAGEALFSTICKSCFQ